MKFIIDKTNLRSILAKVQGITGRRTNLAITDTVLIQAMEMSVRLTATDLETGFEGEYPASVEEGGQIAINAKKLYEIVREFPFPSVNINEVENRWIEIGNQNIEYHIVGMNPDDFPDSPKVEDVDFFAMDGGALRRMIERTVNIQGAAEDKRAHINGVYFETLDLGEKKVLRMVSTDGSRLSTADYPCPEEGLPFEGGALIPKKGLNEVLRFLSGDEAVQVGIKDNHFIVSRDAETVTIRLLEGDFPQYYEIVKDLEGPRVHMERQLFLMTLKRMSILSSESYKGVIFRFEDNRLVIRAANPEIGESKEEMNIAFDVDVIEAAFNPKFFIDTLNLIGEDTVVLSFTEAGKPFLVQAEEDKSYLSIIMPMKA